MNLDINARADGIAVITWSEPTSLDASNVPELRERIGAVERDHSRIVLDMNQVDFIDSSIMGELVRLLRRARAAGGDLKLTRLTPEIETILEVTRLQRVFRIHPSVAAAIEDFNLAVT